MIHDDLIKQKNGPLAVEQRQSKLAKNAEDTERWQRRLFRAASELKRLSAQRKRLLRGPTDKLRYRGEQLTGIGGGSVAGLDDDLEGI